MNKCADDFANRSGCNNSPATAPCPDSNPYKNVAKDLNQIPAQTNEISAAEAALQQKLAALQKSEDDARNAKLANDGKAVDLLNSIQNTMATIDGLLSELSKASGNPAEKTRIETALAKYYDSLNQQIRQLNDLKNSQGGSNFPDTELAEISGSDISTKNASYNTFKGNFAQFKTEYAKNLNNLNDSGATQLAQSLSGNSSGAGNNTGTGSANRAAAAANLNSQRGSDCQISDRLGEDLVANCKNTNQLIDQGNIINTITQTVGGQVVGAIGNAAASKAQGDGKISSALEGSAKAAKAGGAMQVAAGTFNLFQGFREQKRGSKHGKSITEAEKGTNAGDITQYMPGEITNGGRAIDGYNKVGARIQSNRLATGQGTALANATATMADTVAGEQSTMEARAKQSAMSRFMNGAQQIMAGMTSFMAAKNLNKAADELKDSSLPPPQFDPGIPPGDDYDPGPIGGPPIDDGGVPPVLPPGDNPITAGPTFPDIPGGDNPTPGPFEPITGIGDPLDNLGLVPNAGGGKDENGGDKGRAPAGAGPTPGVRVAGNDGGGAGGGGGGGLGGGGGGGTKPNTTPQEKDPQAQSLAGGDGLGGGRYGSGGAGGAGGGADGEKGPDLSGLLAALMPKEEEEKPTNDKMQFGELGAPDEDLFKRVTKVYMGKAKGGTFGDSERKLAESR